MMAVAGRQALRVLDGSYVLDRPAEGTDVDRRADVPRPRSRVLAPDQLPQDGTRLGNCLHTRRRTVRSDLVLTCSKFLTSDYAPRLRARSEIERQPIEDATARGWQREIERHTATRSRLEQLLNDLRCRADRQ